MPARRRRSSTRDPVTRYKMWDAKMNPDVYSTLLQTTKQLARERVAQYQFEHEFLIDRVKDVLARFPNEVAITQEYMWYAQHLKKLLGRYSSAALQKEVDAIYLFYIVRGLKDIPLRLIAHSLGLKVSPPDVIAEKVMAPILMSVIARGTLVADGTEQTILTYTGDIAMIQGYIDLSSMSVGDSVTIRLYVKIKPDGEFKLYKEENYAAPSKEELVYVLPRLSGYGIKITLQQTYGSYKSFDYLFIKST